MMARLTGRGTEAPSDIARRLRSALIELQAVPEFDYVVVNDDLDECLREIRAIAETGAAPEPPEQDAESFREEIRGILEAQYGEIEQDNE